MKAADTYRSFPDLKRSEPPSAYRIRPKTQRSEVLVIAIHGGQIEPGTSEIAELIAGETYNLYRFEGRKKPGQNQVLHITSQRFNEPEALKLVARSSVVLSIHGHRRSPRTIYVGGRDTEMCKDLASALAPTGLLIKVHRKPFRATRRLNICNRGARGRGAQLEISRDLRRSEYWRERIATIAQAVIAQHVTRLGDP
jgi:phage replication-related protein YjqB (UPF0714/DUF867 family)